MFDLSEDWVWRCGEIILGLKRHEIEADEKLKDQFINFMHSQIKGINPKLDKDIENITKQLKGE